MTKQKRITKKSTPRTKATASARISDRLIETDGTYFLKLVVFVLLGTFWLRFETPVTWLGFPLYAVPLGALVGFILVRQFEKMQSDRKIWYAILIVITIACYYTPTGIII